MALAQPFKPAEIVGAPWRGEENKVSRDSRRFNQEDINLLFKNYRFSDQECFSDGLHEIVDGLRGFEALLEIGCGHGELAAFIALRFPSIKIIAIDIDKDKINEAKTRYANMPNLSFVCKDIFSSNELSNDSFDVVYGVAVLHHIQNNITLGSERISSILKKNGKCAFIFEPWGINPLISAIRAALNSYYKNIDEANLYDNTLKLFSKNFRDYTVYYYNLIGYFCKILPQSFLSYYISKSLHFIDKIIFKLIPRLLKYSANVNIVFYK